MINSKSKKKVYRKKRRTFKLKGGTYLNSTLKPKFHIPHPLHSFVQDRLDDNYIIFFIAV